MQPAILHADVDAFFASVAQRDDARLRGRPMLVGTWVVMAASYEARAYGVRGGMHTREARRLCPEVTVVEPDWASHVEASQRAVRDLRPLRRDGRAGLDGGGLPRRHRRGGARPPRSRPGCGARCARRPGCRSASASRAGRCSRSSPAARPSPTGCSSSSRTASSSTCTRWRSSACGGSGPPPPAGSTRTASSTVGQAAALSEPELMALLGKPAGRYVHAVAQNREHRPVRSRRGPPAASTAATAVVRSMSSARGVAAGRRRRGARRRSRGWTSGSPPPASSARARPSRRACGRGPRSCASRCAAATPSGSRPPGPAPRSRSRSTPCSRARCPTTC